MLELFKDLFPIFFPPHKKETIITNRNAKPKPKKENGVESIDEVTHEVFFGENVKRVYKGLVKPKPPKES